MSIKFIVASNPQITQISDTVRSICLVICIRSIGLYRDTYSARSASIGSSFAARHAGHSPLIMPTIDETPTPSTRRPDADQQRKSDQRGDQLSQCQTRSALRSRRQLP